MRDKAVKSTVTIAEIAAIVEKAWHEAFDVRKMERLNADVGYYIDADGFLQWDLTRIMLPELDARAAPSALASAAPAAPATLTAPVVSNFGGRAAVQAAQQEQEEAIAIVRADVAKVFAVHDSVLNIAQPVVPRPTQPAERGRGARKHSRDGLIVGGEEWEAWQAEKKETAAKAVTKKAATALAFWARHRATVRAVEEKLEDGVEVEDLNVSELKALIISRTGKTAKTAKGGKAALLIEAASAMSRESCIPPTPPRPPQDENDGNGAVCECGTAADADLEPDEEGYSWCGHCGGRLLE